MEYIGMDVTPDVARTPAASPAAGDDWTNDIHREFWDAAWTLDDEWQPGSSRSGQQDLAEL